METKKKYFMDCHVAGRMYHDADEVWNKLKVGTKLSIVREADNRYDGNAVAIAYVDNRQTEPVCIGYIPRGENELLASFLDMGYQDIFECRINRVNPEAHPEQQLHITIWIKRKEKK